MKFVFRLCGLLLLIASLPVARAQTSSLKVRKIEIQHVGPSATSDELVRGNIRVKVGEPYLRAAVDDDVRNLYATGQFYNIRVTDQSTSDGVVLTYLLQGKPRLTEIKITGNVKMKESKVRKKITSKTGEPLDERKLFTDCLEIKKMYEQAGYPSTKVTYLPNIDENAGRGTATIQIVETPKLRITDVQFAGIHAFPEHVGIFEKLVHPGRTGLSSVIKTRRHGMWSWITSSGVFKDDQFEDDKDKLAEFYREKGYIDFEIKEVQIEHPTPKTMVVRFLVYEGSQYKVGGVKFSGNSTFSTNEISKGLRALHPGTVLKKAKTGPNGLLMDVGDTFTPKGYDEDVKAIQDFYGSKGYIDLSSARNLEVVKVPNTESGTMDLEFKIVEGQKSYIEKIEIRGNIKTKDRVIRRELAVAPGEVFDMTRVNLSKQRMEGLNYFEKVDTRPEATDVPSRKNLVVGVDEKNTGNMTMGAGFSSVDSLVGFAEVTQGNFDLFHAPTFTGGGQKLRLRVQLGTRRQDYEAEFIEPWFLERKLSLDVNLFYRKLDYLSPNSLYNEVDAGTRIGLTRALGNERLIGGLGYSFEDIGILFNNPTVMNPVFGNMLPDAVVAPPTLMAESGYSLVTKFNGSLAYDTRGAGFLPDKGQRTELTAELAGPFGGQKDFYRLELQTAWYFKGLFPGHVIEIVGATGVADSWGRSSYVPFYERWYLGGLDTLRGFRYRGVSPRDYVPGAAAQSNEPVGGDSYWFGSGEYSVPIIEMLRVAAFYDVGNVEANAYRLGSSNLDSDWGLGLRLNIPHLGPLRLDYAIPMMHDSFNGSSGRFQFGVGYTRKF